MATMIYLRLTFQEEDLEEAASDLIAANALAAEQEGFEWAEVLRRDDGKTFIVLSQWQTPELAKEWEHHAEHEAIMSKYRGRYAEKVVVRKFQSL